MSYLRINKFHFEFETRIIDLSQALKLDRVREVDSWCLLNKSTKIDKTNR